MASSQGTQARVAEVGRKSIARLRDIVRAGGLSSLAKIDRVTGEVIDQEGRALFSSLPAVTPATSPDELISHGIIPSIPEGLSEAHQQPKYRPGRHIFVRSTVTHESSSPRHPVGGYRDGGEMRFTHRGVLRAQNKESFLVELEGSSGLLPFAKSDVYAWNEPSGVAASGGTISGAQIDYNDPRFKAHICAGYIEIADAVASLDFRKEEAEVSKAQADIVYRLGAMVNMDYAGRSEAYSGGRVGALINGGQGVCFVQRAVAGAFLQAFARVLAFEVQVAVGRTLRLGMPHGFVVVTLLPSMDRFVCDPAWSEPLTQIEVAFFGPGWGHDRRLEGFEGERELVVRPAQVDVPDVSEM